MGFSGEEAFAAVTCVSCVLLQEWRLSGCPGPSGPWGLSEWQHALQISLSTFPFFCPSLSPWPSAGRWGLGSWSRFGQQPLSLAPEAPWETDVSTASPCPARGNPRGLQEPPGGSGWLHMG